MTGPKVCPRMQTIKNLVQISSFALLLIFSALTMTTLSVCIWRQQELMFLEKQCYGHNRRATAVTV